ncbi:MAG: J domain-containing protein [Candidatus Rokubacteria bacterium]|nr:J domain-containing protein [Candidatus Rokubacteria bacterium]
MSSRRWPRKDYYQLLGVGTGAAEEEIKRAYRRLALQYHPDRNPGDRAAEERFKELSEAYAVLSDPVKRREYDGFRLAQDRHESFRGRAWSRDDLFRDLFADPGSADLLQELAREFSRLGFRFDDRFVRDTFFGGRGIFFGGVVVFGPFGFRRVVFGSDREQVTGRARPQAESAPPADEPPSLAGFLGWLGSELRALVTAPVEGVRRLLALGSGRGGADLIRPLELTADEARAGGPKRVTLERDERVEELIVKIPPGIRPGTRLRLRGKGVYGGDLYLKVDVK